MHMIVDIVVIGLIGVFVLGLLYKTGVVRTFQTSRVHFIRELGLCEFCLTFWICLITSLVVCGVEWSSLIIMMASHTITNMVKNM